MTSISVKLCSKGAPPSAVSVRPGDTLSALLATTGHANPSLHISHVIVKGRRLDTITDGDRPIDTLGITDGAACMLVARPAGGAAAQEARMAKLREIERAASLLAERDSGGAGGGYELEISNQDGSKIELPAADRKAFSLGALLHAKATAHIGSLSRRLRAALESLPPPLAEEEEAELKAAIALSKGEGIDEAATREGQQEGGGEEGGGPEGGGCVASLSEAKHLLEEAEAAFALLSPRFASLGDNVALCSLECVWVVTLQQLLARSSTVEAATLDQATGVGAARSASLCGAPPPSPPPASGPGNTQAREGRRAAARCPWPAGGWRRKESGIMVDT